MASEARTLTLEELAESPRPPLSLAETLGIAREICAQLRDLHTKGQVHGRLLPNNVHYESLSRRVQLGPPMLASGVTADSTLPADASGLAYEAPERTGRLDRPTDGRADLYSLGAILYRLLTGRPPFTEPDLLELVHAVLAKVPPAPSTLVPTIPPLIDDMVMLLLRKAPEERYASSLGLLADLDRCLAQLATSSTLAPFPLRNHDPGNRLELPTRLYGRASEISTVRELFAAVLRGEKRLLLVTGAAGAGKSSLVRECHGFFSQANGVFLEGKFDQVQGDSPYVAFGQALSDWTLQTLTLSPTLVDLYKHKILEAVGGLGQVVIDLAPDLELVIGPQPELYPLGGSEAQNRFHRVVSSFVGAIASSHRPLVLFQDDMQWADPASLALLETLLGDSAISGLFLIGAYRAHEIGEGHPLEATLARLTSGKTPPATLSLGDLGEDEVTHLVADALKIDPEESRALSRLVIAKTAGNPFFVHRMLHLLADDHLLVFDGERGRWHFSAEAISVAQVADNVVDLIAGRLMRLALPCRNLVARASFLGSSFDLETLAVAAGISPNEVLRTLEDARASGLLSVEDNLVRFAHDRIQQAAQSLVSVDEARTIHLEIGERLFSSLAPADLQDRIYDIANHLNEGEALLAPGPKRKQLAEINLLAARKAKRAVAYASANSYLAAGLALLDGDIADEDYALWLALAGEALEASYLQVDFETTLLHCAHIDRMARSPVDRAKATIHRMLIAVATMHPEESLRIGREYLQALNLTIRDTPLGDIDPESVLARPPMTDPRMLAAVEVLVNMFPSAYMLSSDVLVRICETAIALCREHGSVPALAYVCAVYGIWACGVANDVESGYRWGKLALAAWQRFDARKDSAKVAHVFNNCIRFFKEPELETIDDTLAAVKYGIEYGDTETAGYASFWYSTHKIFACAELDPLPGAFDAFIAMNVRHGMRFSETGVRISRQCLANLMGDVADPCLFVGEFIDEAKLRQEAVHEKSHRILLYWLSVAKLYLCYLFGRSDVAVACAKEAEELETPAVGITVPFRFHDALACLDLAAAAPSDCRASLLERADRALGRLRTWSKHAPFNFAHRQALVQAERARVLGEVENALAYYETACEGAARQGYTIDLALGLERLGRFQLERGLEKIAALSLREAVATYRKSGMRAKADRLTEEVRQRLGDFVESTSATLRGRTLDVDTIIKAARSFSSEIVMDALLRRILDVVVQSTGAQKGFLILVSEGEPEVVAESRHDLEGIKLLESIRVDNRHDLSAGIVRYVARTGRSVVLRDATAQKDFGDDPYVREHHPRSVACVPLTNLGHLSGIVYLENNLITNAFTEERSELLRVLSSLMAISLDNARLYDAIRNQLARREQAEQELRRSEENLSVTLRSIADGVVTTDADDKIVAMNPAAERITGYPVEQALGLPYVEVIPERHSGETTSITDRSGVKRIIEGTLSPITDARGFRVGAVRVLRDVTEKRQREAHFLQSQRLDFIGQLAGGLAHDFNNQLVAILGYAELIALRADEPDIKDDARTIVKAARGASDLTRQLLMLGRKVEVEKTVFDVHEVIREAMSLLTRSLAKGVELRLFLDAETPSIAGDRTFLQNAVLNIGLNAKDAMPQGGSLEVRTANVRVPGEGPDADAVLSAGRYLRIRMKDTGIGMSPEVCRRVIEPFFTTKEKGHGTGLGLATAYATLRSHGGWLAIESELGKGTTVTLYLPTIAQVEAEPARAVRPPTRAPRRLRILVVDDEPSVSSYLKLVLTSEGHDVLLSSSGEAALEVYAVEGAHIDCVFLDMVMPGMGGRKTFEAIRRINPNARIVICTGYATGEDLTHVLASGAVGVLRKPFYRDDVFDIVRRASEPADA